MLTFSTRLTELWQLDPQQAQELAHYSAGRYGLTYDFYQHPQISEQIQQWLLDAFELLRSNRLERFNFAENHPDPRRKGVSNKSIAIMLQTWLILWREILLIAAKSTAPLTYLQFSPWIDRATAYLGHNSVVTIKAV